MPIFRIISAKRRSLVAALFPAVCLWMGVLPGAMACPYSIRDVGFVDLDSVPYRLYFFVRDDTAQKESRISTFERTSQVVLSESNVAAEVVNVDRQNAHPAMEYLRFWEVETFPAAILISPRGQSLVAPIFDPKLPFRQTADSALENLVSSPVRDEVLGKVVRAWCVLLLVEGKDATENAKARKAVTEAIADVARSMNRAGRTVEEAPHLIVLSPESSKGEEVLLWSLGLEQYGGRGARVAVLYGRGRQFGPVLEGDDLTRQTLVSMLNVLGMKCGCDVSLDWLSNTMIPHRWGQAIRASVAKDLGFDPDNPMVKMEVSGVWEGEGEAEEPDGGVFAYAEGEIVNWDEYSQFERAMVATAEGAAPAASPGADAAMAVAPGTASTLERRLGRVMVFVVLIVALAVLGGGAVVLSRARRRNAAS